MLAYTPDQNVPTRNYKSLTICRFHCVGQIHAFPESQIHHLAQFPAHDLHGPRDLHHDPLGVCLPLA